MRRVPRDVPWFVIAVVLLAAGAFGWWRYGSELGRWGFGYGQSGGLMLAIWSAGAIILLTWWRSSAVPEGFDAPLMGPLALAASAPLSMLPLIHFPATISAVAGISACLAVLPLARMLAARLMDPVVRRRAAVVVVLAIAGGAWLAWSMGVGDMDVNPNRSIRWALVAIATLIPAALLTGAILRGQGADARPAEHRLLEALAVLVVGVAPVVTGLSLLVDGWQLLVLPAVAVLATLLVVGRFALCARAGSTCRLADHQGSCYPFRADRVYRAGFGVIDGMAGGRVDGSAA